MRHTTLKVLHVLAVGTWFGGAAFFNFVTAVTVFDTFKQVVNAGPSDRTAHQRIIDPAAPQAEKDALASALAGSAVGPVFPKYFAMQAVCGVVALVTAVRWWNASGTVHRWRVYVIGLAVLTVAVGWPISDYVSELRLLRFDPNPEAAAAARAAFGPWHLASLALSTVTVCLAGIGLGMAACLPAGRGEPRA
jgi:glycerol-3-phosphate acyltransferase PlsY